MLCNLFLLQLAIMQWDKQDIPPLTATLTDLLQQMEQQQQAGTSAGQQPSSRQQGSSQQQQQQQGEQESSAAEAVMAASRLAYLKLHFNLLRLMTVVQSGNFKELYGDNKEAAAPGTQVPAMVEEVDELLQQLQQGSADGSEQQQGPRTSSSAAAAARQRQRQQQQGTCGWLPVPVLAGAVHLLAAMVDKPAGKQKQGQARISRGA